MCHAKKVDKQECLFTVVNSKQEDILMDMKIIKIKTNENVFI